jgi:CheY-like chemotaxis protein
MLAYAGRGTIAVQRVSLRDVVHDMVQLLGASISKRHALTLDIAGDLPAVEADPAQMRQIVMNLVINASEAIGDREGVITVRLGSVGPGKDIMGDVAIGELGGGPHVHLEVADTGDGMDAATLQRIFDPFFTTKFTGRGLGMAAVLGIVRGHKGAIGVSSEPGKGSVFTIYLPTSASEPDHRVGPAEAQPWRGQGRVLLVDDEESVRMVGAEMLRELGFEVETAADGIEALERCRERRPDLVVLDLTMPRMDGEQAFRELRARYPALRVVMSSGYNEAEIAQRFPGAGPDGFVQKPYTLSALKGVLRAALR